MLALVMSSCSMKQEGPSRLTIQVPSVSALNSSQKISSLSYAWANACFMVSVKGEGIETTTPNACSIETGRFSGSVAPGGVLSIEVPKGAGRSLDLFVFFKSGTGACPTATSLAAFNASSTVRVAQVASFDTFASETNLNVTVSLPNSSENLITQYSLPSTCKANSFVPGTGSSAIVAGHAIQSGGSFKAQTTVSGRQSEKALTGGGFVMKLTRRPNEE